MCPQIWPIEDICIGLYVLKRLLTVWHILEKVMSMQHSFEEFSEKQRIVELKSAGNFVANFVLSRSATAVKLNFFVALFMLSLCPFDISVGVGFFVIGLSQIFSFLSLCYVIIARNGMIIIQYHNHIMCFCLTVNIYYLRSDVARSNIVRSHIRNWPNFCYKMMHYLSVFFCNDITITIY